MISKAHYIKLAKSLYDVSIGKNVEGDFKALPRAWGRLRISRRGVSRKDIAAVLGCDNSVGGISCIALRPYN